MTDHMTPGPDEPAVDRGTGDHPTRDLGGGDRKADDGYSATALDTGWGQQTGDAQPAATVRLPPSPPTPPPPVAPVSSSGSGSESAPTSASASGAPDRVEGEVLRFGPGVTARAHRTPGGTATAVWHGTLPGHGPGGAQRVRRRRGGLRRYTLAAVVLLGVVGFLLWQRIGPALAVESVSVRTDPAGPACDGTADVVGVVRTNGEPGTIDYRWLRSDGTTSGTLREKVTQGRREVRLHLLWTFHGQGSHQARAELEITSPAAHTASARFTYDCR